MYEQQLKKMSVFVIVYNKKIIITFNTAYFKRIFTLNIQSYLSTMMILNQLYQETYSLKTYI